MCRVSLTFNALRQDRRTYWAIAFSDAISMPQLRGFQGSKVFSASITFSMMFVSLQCNVQPHFAGSDVKGGNKQPGDP